MAKILIIEDDPRLEQTYNFIFLQQGHTVIRASDGQAGLEKAEEENPDVILLDMMMPIMSGLEFMEKFDLKNKHPNTKVIAFSNLQDEAAMQRMIELGASRYEIKATFSPKQIQALVEELLQERDQQGANVSS